jgi:20S proteasome alpha/beta subunit
VLLKPSTPQKQRLPDGRRMSIAAGFRCNGGVVFGADTEETVGELRRRAVKIRQLVQPSFCTSVVTGACDNAHLMDTFIERIFDAITQARPNRNDEMEKLLRNTAIKLYAEDFKQYPGKAKSVHLLIATKLPNDNVEAWSVKSSVVRKMQDGEILGTGQLVEFVSNHLYRPGMQIDDCAIMMAQLLRMAREKVVGVGGESYIAAPTDRRWQQRNMHFHPELEELFWFFATHGAGLLLATGNDHVSDVQYAEAICRFSENMKFHRNELRQSGHLMDIKRDDEE